MKTKKNENTFKYEFIKENELENDLHKLNEEGIELAVEHALDNSGQDLPKQKSSPRPFLGVLTAFYSKAIGMIQTVLSSALSKYDLKEAQKELDTIESECAKDMQAVENTIRLKGREKEKQEKSGNIPIQKGKRWPKLRPINFAVVLLDIGFSYYAFAQMGYNLLFSIAIACGIGLAIFLLSEHWPEVVGKLQNRRKKTIAIIALFMVLLAVFYVIGYFRSMTLEESSGVATSPWYFAILNLFFFSVVSMVVLLHKPNGLERKKLDDYKTLLDELKEAQKKKIEITAKLENARNSFKEKKESREKILLYAISLESLVTTQYESACQHYASTNIQRRSDGVVPDMFESAPPALNLHFTKQQS